MTSTSNEISNYLASLSKIPTQVNGVTQIPLSSSVQTYYTNQGLAAPDVPSNLVTSIAFSPVTNADDGSSTTLPSNSGSIIYSAIGQSISNLVSSNTALTLDNLVTQIQNNVLVATNGQYIISPSAVYNGLLEDFAAAQGITLSPTTDSSGNIEAATVGGDWSILNSSPAVTPPVDFSATVGSSNNYSSIQSAWNASIGLVYGGDQANFYSYFTGKNGYLPGGQSAPYVPENSVTITPATGNSFVPFLNSVLSSMKFTGVTGNANLTSSFLNQFHQSLSSIATIQPSTIVPLNNLISYQAFYNIYNTTGEDFSTFMKAFYSQQVSNNGFFSPSVDFAAFAAAVNAANPNPHSIVGGSSSISGTDSSKALILNRIILLLIQIIGTLQNIGIAQANNLTYLTQFQNAYTSLLQQVPTFLGKGGPHGSIYDTSTGANTGTQATNARNELNSSFNGILSDNLRSLRSVVTNKAKTVQSNINTTNDAVNQQTGMITSLLQEMSQLLGAIFR